MDTSALEQFKNRLAQTIFWCVPRVDKANPATSLRTPTLRPRLLEENRSSAVNTVVYARELFGGVDIRKATIPTAPGGGRLLVYFPNNDLACGAAEQDVLTSTMSLPGIHGLTICRTTNPTWIPLTLST